MIMDLGLIDYEECYKIQREMVTRRKLGEIEDSLILAEHNSVFTTGRSGGRDNLRVDESYLRQKGIKVVGVDRGGNITFHGPGQLVIYPIIKLIEGWRDLHKYMRNLEDMVIKFFDRYSIHAGREIGKTGVWVSGKKVASIGVSVSSWITYHGVSVNIKPEMGFFDMIYPCGLRGVEMASLSSLSGRDVPMKEAKEHIVSDFDSVFNSGRVNLPSTLTAMQNSEQNDKMKGS